jgi:hypothetical protein
MVDGDMLRIVMSSVMCRRSGVIFALAIACSCRLESANARF